jgi:fatty-acyl-CoA synthase
MLSAVGDLVDLAARRAPRTTALKIRDGAGLNYDELREQTNRLANALLGSGLEPGDRVGAWMEDMVEYPVVYVALAKAGLVVVPINTRYRAAEAAHCLQDSGARGLIFTGGVTAVVEELADMLEGMLLVSDDGSGPAGTRRLGDLLRAGDNSTPPRPDPESPVVLAYTSGTTGNPKGAILTHRSVLAISRMNTVSYRLPPYSVAAITGTLSFPAMMPAQVLSHFYVAGTAILMGAWDPERLVDTIERERVTFTYLATPMMRDFATYAATVPERWASLTSVLHSSALATPQQRAELCEVIGGRYVEGWGMTENSGGLMTATTSTDFTDTPPGVDYYSTAGRAAIEVVVEVLDPAGHPLPHDGETLGELVYQSSSAMSGYWNRPEATESALAGGWLHSGDLGMIDEHGYVYVTERRTDLIVSGGMNVYPSEVERVIMEIPSIRECIVVGAPHERWGQTPVAVIIGPAGDVTEEMVIAHCVSGLASYKKPTRVVFVDDVPRTPSLKVKRVELREQIAARRD